MALTAYCILTRRTVASREIGSTVQNGTGDWVQNPELSWTGDWVVQCMLPLYSPLPGSHFNTAIDSNAAPIMNTKPTSLASFYLNISDCTLLKIYGVGGNSYSLNFNWEETPQ
jgi:hypothetical protein